MKTGGDSSEMRYKAYEMKLTHHKGYIKDLKQSPVCTAVEVSGTESSCEKCKALHGQIIDIEKVLDNSPLPVRDCTHKYGRRCAYFPVAE